METDTFIDHLMPVGRYREQPIGALRTPYLAWWLSQDKLRRRYPLAAAAVVAALRQRLAQPGQAEAELIPAPLAGGARDDFSDLI